MLDKDESVSIHHQNIQKLGIEMFKVLNGENPQIVNETFRIRDETSHKLPQRSCFHIPSVNTVFSGTESIRFLGPKIWELIPNDIKCLENLRDFKTAIKKANQHHVHVESAKHISMALDLYSKCL